MKAQEVQKKADEQAAAEAEQQKKDDAEKQKLIAQKVID
jgi:hypothetical protein